MFKFCVWRRFRWQPGNAHNPALPPENLRSRPLIEVQRVDISRVHLMLRHKHFQANRLVAVFSKFFNWAEKHGLRPDGRATPADTLKSTASANVNAFCLRRSSRSSAALSPMPNVKGVAHTVDNCRDPTADSYWRQLRLPPSQSNVQAREWRHEMFG